MFSTLVGKYEGTVYALISTSSGPSVHAQSGVLIPVPGFGRKYYARLKVDASIKRALYLRTRGTR